MGVLACERDGCQNIMCNTIIQRQYYNSYICDDCYEELVIYKDRLTNPITIERMRDLIDEFMGFSRENMKNPNSEEIEEVFNQCIVERKSLGTYKGW